MEAEGKIKAGDYPMPYRPRMLKRAIFHSSPTTLPFESKRESASFNDTTKHDNIKRKDEDSKAPQQR